MVKPSALLNSSFTLHRFGTFSCLVSGPNHCGPTSGNLNIKYDLRVTCTADSLDDRGFLFNQMMVDAYFQGIGKSSLSCEAMVVAFGRELYRRIKAENEACHIVKFELKLSPFPHQADMTFQFEEKWNFLKPDSK